MSEREPGDGSGERPGRDPVNHHPPEEWRPGDAGDPIEGGPQPPGEPPHGGPGGGDRDLSSYGGSAPEPPSGQGASAWTSNGSGELSEGPSGPGGAGGENIGYAPGYGDYPSSPAAYGGQGHATGPSPTPWGKIFGLGCGVLLLLLVVLGGCATVMLFMAGTDAPAGVGPLVPVE